MNVRLATALVLSLTILPVARLGSQVVQTGFLDRVATLNGVAFRYQVYVPPNYSAAQRWPVILFLHGAGERGSDGLLQTTAGLGSAIRRRPSSYPAIVVFPQAAVDSSWIGIPAQVAMTARSNAGRIQH
jgi:predicted peptidase